MSLECWAASLSLGLISARSRVGLTMVSIFCNDNDEMRSQYHNTLYCILISQYYVNNTGDWSDLSPCSRRCDPEPDGVARDAKHGAARHHVANNVRPPGVVVLLVDQVLPGHELQFVRNDF